MTRVLRMLIRRWIFGGALACSLFTGCNRKTEHWVPKSGAIALDPLCPVDDGKQTITACLSQCDRVCGDADCRSQCGSVCNEGLFTYGPAKCVGACGTSCAEDAACLAACLDRCAGAAALTETPLLAAPVITAGPAAVTSTNTATFTFVCGGGQCGGYECRLSPGPWEACASPVVYLNLWNGEQAFEVRQTAGAACASAESASWTWTVDMGAPPTSPPAAWPVAPTGQRVCYHEADEIPCPATGEAFYGQDAQYAAAATTLAVHGDGTVTDTARGLMWQRQDDGQLRNRQAALSYCAALTLAGHADWRVPSTAELITIVDYGVLSPAIDKTVFPGTKSSFYWTGTPSADNPDDGWVVLFSFGTVLEHLVATSNIYTRCVRSTP